MEQITIEGEVFSLCTGGHGADAHAPVYVEGHFRALCPLCAANVKAAEAAETAANVADNTAEKARALANIIENVSERLAGVTAENVVAVSRDVRGDMLEALGAVRRMPGADV